MYVVAKAEIYFYANGIGIAFASLFASKENIRGGQAARIPGNHAFLLLVLYWRQSTVLNNTALTNGIRQMLRQLGKRNRSCRSMTDYAFVRRR